MHIFAVYNVRERSGEWHYRAYRLNGMGDFAKQKPPTTLEKRFVGRVHTSTSGRAIRAAIEHESVAQPQEPA